MISLKRGVVIKSLAITAKKIGQQTKAPEKSLLCHEDLLVSLFKNKWNDLNAT